MKDEISSPGNWIERLVALEAEVQYQRPAAPGETDFAYQPGEKPLLISAPHGAVHTRNGKLKEEDEYTAGIARLVGELSGAHVLYACRQSDDDPNRQVGGAYKTRLAQVVTQARIDFVLDLHGVLPRREFGLALGLMNGRSAPRRAGRLIEILECSGYRRDGAGLERLEVDLEGYQAKGNETVTRFVWETMGVEAAQLEINANLRIAARKEDASWPGPFQAQPERVLQLLQALKAAVVELTQ